MMNADRPDGPLGQSQASKKVTDLLVVGGGIMGLWAALKAARLGLTVTLVEKRAIGAGASGGLIGALMPYMPDKWDAKKQFQFNSLLAIEEEIAALEDETGLKTGYRRSGRLIPLPKPHLRDIALRHEQDALKHWHAGERQFYWHVSDYDAACHSVSEQSCASGVIEDTMAARVSPRAYVAVMRRAVERNDKITIIEGMGVSAIDHLAATATLSNGDTLSFAHVMISSGYEAFPLIRQAICAQPDLNLGQGIKGQSALLKANIDPASPVIFLNGVYIIPHEDGTVAVGSTSENTFTEPFSIDSQLDAMIDKAFAMMPELKDATLIEKWAGLRPRAIAREPMIGSVADAPNVIALAGGFKITFGIAHHLADAALTYVTGGKPNLPEKFSLEHHLRFAHSLSIEQP